MIPSLCSVISVRKNDLFNQKKMVTPMINVIVNCTNENIKSEYLYLPLQKEWRGPKKQGTNKLLFVDDQKNVLIIKREICAGGGRKRWCEKHYHIHKNHSLRS